MSRKVQPILFCLTPQEGREGDKAKCKGVVGGGCLRYIIPPFPVGIFLWGLYTQQVSGCVRGQDPGHGCLPPRWALSLAQHQPVMSWLPVFLGLPAMCFEGRFQHTACLVLVCHEGWAHGWAEDGKGTSTSSAPRSPCLSPGALWATPQS